MDLEKWDNVFSFDKNKMAQDEQYENSINLCLTPQFRTHTPKIL